MKNYVKKILVSKKVLIDFNFESLKNALVYMNNNLIDSDDNIFGCRFIDGYKPQIGIIWN